MGQVTAPSLPIVWPRPPRHRRQRNQALVRDSENRGVSSLTGAAITSPERPTPNFAASWNVARPIPLPVGRLIRETASPLIAAGLTTLASASWSVEIPPTPLLQRRVGCEPNLRGYHRTSFGHCSLVYSIQRRPPVTPRRRLLVGVREAQHRRVVEARANDLERQRQAAVGIAAAHRYRGAAGHVEWHRE